MPSHTSLIVGVGNPGTEYVGTRHNVGFEVVEVLAAKYGCTFRGNARWSALVARSVLSPFRTKTRKDDRVEHVIFAKPTTYMNESGRAAAALVRNFRRAASGWQLVVIHDDLDLSVGALRLSTGGSSGGHKGVQSIIDALDTDDFLRLRIGIGPNATPDGHRIPAEDFVLKRFSNTERPEIDAAIARAVEVIEMLLRDGFNAAQRLASSPAA